jgi:hypothetical protein
VGNCKTGKVGKIASGVFKGAHGDFNGYVILTDLYGYEVWEELAVVAFPPDFAPPEAPPA